MSLPLFEKLFEGSSLVGHVPLSGKDLRDLGIDDAYDKAVRVKAEYVERCSREIKSIPTGALITSEDVREKAGDPPSEISPNCMAGILKKAASQGLIQITNERVHAKRASLHAAELRCWARL